MKGMKGGVFRFRHTTKVSVSQTAGEIQGLLVRLGASNIASSVEGGEIVSMAFTYDDNGERAAFKLPIRWRPIYDTMHTEWASKSRKRLLGGNEEEKAIAKMMAQAKRTGWRIALEWLKIQVAFVETGARRVLEVFMADLITPGSDQTLGQYVLERGIQGLLPAPDGNEE